MLLWVGLVILLLAISKFVGIGGDGRRVGEGVGCFLVKFGESGEGRGEVAALGLVNKTHNKFYKECLFECYNCIYPSSMLTERTIHILIEDARWSGAYEYNVAEEDGGDPLQHKQEDPLPTAEPDEGSHR
jgi:hypothetical protein